MTSAELLTDAFSRIRDVVHHAVDGLGSDQLAYRIDDEANSIGWLIWHLTRVQDDHVSDLAGGAQVWTEQGWAERFDLPFDETDIGYGHSPEQVAAVRVDSGDVLTDYHDAVHEHTIAYISTLSDDDLPRIIDQSWDPPVTIGVRLISVIADDLQHAGQAEFIRGILERR